MIMVIRFTSWPLSAKARVEYKKHRRHLIVFLLFKVQLDLLENSDPTGANNRLNKALFGWVFGLQLD